MGIFTVPTASVRKTRIYVSPSPHRHQEQLTVYKTEVNTLFDGGFMILPVPYPESVRFHNPDQPHPHNLFPYLDFLDRVERAFNDRERPHTFTRPIDPNQVASYRRIEIIDSIDDLRELNHREAILHDSVVNQLAEIYHQPYWGFILCRIQQGSFVYEPLCYTHRLIDQELFIPALIYQPRSFNDAQIPEETDRYDDRYFMNGCYYSEHMGYHLIEANPRCVSTIPWGILPPKYREYLQYFLSESRRGMHWNGDALYRINHSLNIDNSNQRHIHHELYSP